MKSVDKPRPSVRVRKSVIKMGEDLNQLLNEVDEFKQNDARKSILDKFRNEYDQDEEIVSEVTEDNENKEKVIGNLVTEDKEDQIVNNVTDDKEEQTINEITEILEDKIEEVVNDATENKIEEVVNEDTQNKIEERANEVIELSELNKEEILNEDSTIIGQDKEENVQGLNELLEDKIEEILKEETVLPESKEEVVNIENEVIVDKEEEIVNEVIVDKEKEIVNEVIEDSESKKQENEVIEDSESKKEEKEEIILNEVPEEIINDFPESLQTKDKQILNRFTESNQEEIENNIPKYTHEEIVDKISEVKEIEIINETPVTNIKYEEVVDLNVEVKHIESSNEVPKVKREEIINNIPELKQEQPVNNFEEKQEVIQNNVLQVSEFKKEEGDVDIVTEFKKEEDFDIVTEGRQEIILNKVPEEVKQELSQNENLDINKTPVEYKEQNINNNNFNFNFNPNNNNNNNTQEDEIKIMNQSKSKSGNPQIAKQSVSGGLIDLDFSNFNREKYVRESLFENQLENIMKMGNTYSTETQIKKPILVNLNTKSLIEDKTFTEEIEKETENIIYTINKTTNEKEIQYIKLNLLMQYITSGESNQKFNFDISRWLLTQHTGIISTDNLIELLNSIILYKTTSNLIEFINNWMIYLYKEQLLNNVSTRLKIVKLYEEIELKLQNDQIIFNKINKVKINEIKEILISNNEEFSLEKKENLSKISMDNFNKNNLNFYQETPIIPVTNKESFDILDWSEIELARQLTIVTFYFFSNIQFKELLNSQWTKVNKNINAPNVTKMIERFNKLSLWVCEEILAYDKGKYRAMAIEKFIRLANELKNLKNFNDCFIIVTALNSFQIKSLSKTWRKISFESVKMCKELNNLCAYSGNYAALREEVENAKGYACIPYLGFYLKELAFIDEGPKYVKEPNLVCVDKIKRVARILESLQAFQMVGYNFKPVFKLSFLSDVCPLTEDELSELSTKLEPIFKLAKSKNKLKRSTTTDFTSRNISPIFNQFLNHLNKNKTSKNLKDQIGLYFKK